MEKINENKGLITESINRDDLIDAINKRKVVYIYYSGVEGKSNDGEGVITKGYRTIEPYLLGITHAGNFVVRAWQQSGASDSNKGLNRIPRPDHDILPGWRLFYVDGITSFLLTGKHFSTNKNKIRPNYNPNDEQMKEIILAIDPDQPETEISGVDSLKKSDKFSDKLSKFDTQTKKFKDFYDDKKNKNQILKKKINDFYELVTKHRKKSPREYFLVYKGDNIVAVTKKTADKLDKKEIIGNLKDLFIKYNPSNRPTKSFFNQQRELFRKSLEK